MAEEAGIELTLNDRRPIGGNLFIYFWKGVYIGKSRFCLGGVLVTTSPSRVSTIYR